MGIEEGDPKDASKSGSKGSSHLDDIKSDDTTKDAEKRKEEEDEEDLRKLEEELARLEVRGGAPVPPADERVDEDAGVVTPPSGTPVSSHANLPDEAAVPPAEDEPEVGAGGVGSQNTPHVLTLLLARLPTCTSRASIDEAAVEFAFIGGGKAGKGGRRRLGKVSQLVFTGWSSLLG